MYYGNVFRLYVYQRCDKRSYTAKENTSIKKKKLKYISTFNKDLFNKANEILLRIELRLVLRKKVLVGSELSRIFLELKTRRKRAQGEHPPTLVKALNILHRVTC